MEMDRLTAMETFVRVIEAGSFSEEAELAARGAAAALSGRLRICAAVTFARLHAMPRLPIVLAAHPALDVDVVLQDGDIDLIEAGIDVALRMSPLRDSALTGRKIGHCQRRCFRPDDRQAPKPALS
jgi:DNA-binding transcriptional LysR family regulator